MVKNLVKFSLVILALAALSSAAEARDGWDRHDRNDHNRDHRDYGHDSYHRSSHSWRSPWHHHGYYVYRPYPYGRAVISLPGGYVKVIFGGRPYYYCHGVFYNRVNTRYVVINPPIGAVVETIPVDNQVIVVNGATYYYSSDVYYQYTPRGYMVVQKPVGSTQLVKADVPPEVINDNGSDYFDVNIPNSNGGYTAVTLKKSGNGFLGPQGEFYPEFPKVEQLKAMYTK